MRLKTAVVSWAVLASLLGGPLSALAGEPFPVSNQLGTSLGLPAGINIEYAHEFGHRALYVAGGFLGRQSHGAQVGVGLARVGKPREHAALALVAGRLRWRPNGENPNEWTYGGLEVYLKYRDFFIATSSTLGDGNMSDNPAAQTDLLVSLRFGLISTF